MAFKNLVNGFRVFRANYIAGNSAELFEKLITEGQAPETLFVACSDSRIDPAILTNAEPGDLFSVRNVAALVPYYDSDGHAHGTSAAIEYAVSTLKVKHIVVLGHALCGGMRALAESPENLSDQDDLISRWISIGLKARDAVRTQMADLPFNQQIRFLEQSAILVSMENLLSFPSVKAAVEKGELDIYGWYFDMPNGKLLSYDSELKKFRSVLSDDAHVPAIAASNYACADALLSLTDFLNKARATETAAPNSVKRMKKKGLIRRWLHRGGYAFAVAVGAVAGASAEEFGALVLTFSQIIGH